MDSRGWAKGLPSSHIDALHRIAALKIAGRKWQARWAEICDDLGHHVGLVDTLTVLADRPEGMLQREIAEALDLTTASMTHRIDGLEQAGLAERQKHPTDRRASVVVATPAGLAVLAEAASSYSEECHRAIDRLGMADVVKLSDLLKRLEP